MSSPHFDFNEENLPQTPGENGFPEPESPVVPSDQATPDSPVAAAASYPLDDFSKEQPSPSREELEGFYGSLGASGSRINRNLFKDDDESEDDDEEAAAAAAAEVEMLEERFGKDKVQTAQENYGAGWIDAIKRAHGYDSSKYGLVPIIVASAPAGAAEEKGKKSKKRKRNKRKRSGGKKKYKKKRTKKKSRKKKRKTLKKKRKRRKKQRKTRR